MNQEMIVDGNKPTQDEIIEHNTRIAKANFCMELAKGLSVNEALLGRIADSSQHEMNIGKQIGLISISCAEEIFSRYPMKIPGKKA